MSVAVVVPVKDGADDLAACLRSLLPQTQALGAELIVVDDASCDRTPELLTAFRVRSLRLETPSGPYVARNAGWRAATAATVVFTDIRCRAEPGWLEAMIAPLDRPEVAITGGDVRTSGVGGPAVRWAIRDQRLGVGRHLDSGFLPYVPTSSMAVRRTVLESLGGFRPLRSGGDVDLCWRAQLAGLGQVVEAPNAVMTMQPRPEISQVVRQWRRFGYGHAALWASYSEAGCPLPAPTPVRKDAVEVLRAVAGLLTRRRRDVGVELVEQRRRLAYHAAYRRAYADAVRAVAISE